jgi:beta-phosphoglucomutase
MIRGVLFDMDGVLVNSEAFICEASVMMFREIGIHVQHSDFQPFVGMGENRYIGGVAEKYKVSTDIEILKSRTYEIYGEIVAGKLSLLPGVIEFIDRCKERSLLLALATSTDRVKMEINLNESGLDIGTFSAIVTGIDVERKKPFPDIYIKAAKLLSLEPCECLVVEDAVSGVEAGKMAGCRCLAVTTSFSKEELHEADWICDSLDSVAPEAINW